MPPKPKTIPPATPQALTSSPFRTMLEGTSVLVVDDEADARDALVVCSSAAARRFVRRPRSPKP